MVGTFWKWAIKFHLCFYECNFDENHLLLVFLGAESDFKLCHLEKVKFSKKFAKGYTQKWAIQFQLRFYECNFDQLIIYMHFWALNPNFKFDTSRNWTVPRKFK